MHYVYHERRLPPCFIFKNIRRVEIIITYIYRSNEIRYIYIIVISFLLWMLIE